MCGSADDSHSSAALEHYLAEQTRHEATTTPERPADVIVDCISDGDTQVTEMVNERVERLAHRLHDPSVDPI